MDARPPVAASRFLEWALGSKQLVSTASMVLKVLLAPKIKLAALVTR